MESTPDWAGVVGKIRENDGRGMEDLYAAISGSVPGMLRASIHDAPRAPQTIEDDLHEILLIVLEAIHGGNLREPACLMGFVRTVTHRQAVAHIRSNIAHRRRFQRGAELAPSNDPSPEERFARRERLEVVLKRLRSRDREILVRFYFHDQPPGQICLEMGLTPTQFRLFKSRALARCFNLAR
jgi:DNA-directed RNA polymerase specialized sigma24 family protein